jgi:hypothetical protein
METAWWRYSLRSCLTHTTPPAATVQYSSKQMAQLPQRTVPRLSGSIHRPLIAEDRVNTSPVCARLVVVKVALWHVVLQVSVVPCHYDATNARTTICHRFYIIWTIDSDFNSTRYKKLNKGRRQSDRFFWRVSKIIISDYCNVCLPLRQYVFPSTWNNSASKETDFSWNLIFEYFSKICRQ